MQISLTGRHVSVTDSIKNYAKEKASKLLKFYDRIQSIEVILDHDAGLNKVEIIVEAEHRNTFVAQESHEDMYAAVDLVVGKLERQLIRHKERHRDRKHSGKHSDRTTEA